MERGEGRPTTTIPGPRLCGGKEESDGKARDASATLNRRLFAVFGRWNQGGALVAQCSAQILPDYSRRHLRRESFL